MINSTKLLLSGALLAILIGGAAAYRSHVWDLGYAQAEADQAARVAVAVVKRVEDNAKTVVKNDNINATITKEKNEELAPVIRTVYVDRVRVGPGVCGPTTTPTAPEDASGGDAGDTAARLVSQRTESDIRALTAEVEKHLATGRTCQAWARAHGFMD